MINWTKEIEELNRKEQRQDRWLFAVCVVLVIALAVLMIMGEV